ncbi:unnamed protein product [Linum tenue]|uniref:Uncharacterized protein n=1 Tax=Linum tenue TaxID=586396 RepID=A0AAV0IUF7_9ROSI|nr:unnamed protein product [Linum tenue]
MKGSCFCKAFMIMYTSLSSSPSHYLLGKLRPQLRRQMPVKHKDRSPSTCA